MNGEYQNNATLDTSIDFSPHQASAKDQSNE